MPTPVSIDSNQTGLSIAEELSLKVLPVTPVWYGLEPNTYADFGASFTNVARETINNTRQRLKGTQTDQSQKAGFNMDLTQRNFTRFLQGFMFADAFEKPATIPFNGAAVPLTSVSATQYLAAAGLSVFKINHLVAAKGFGVSTNNGLKHLTAVAAGAVTTDSAVAVEAGPPATASLEAVGIRGAAGDLHISIVGSNVLITSTALDFTTLGLNIGEWVFVGGDAAINRWVTSNVTTNTNVGYARISAIAVHQLTFDFTSFNPVLDADAGNLQKVDIYFGKVLQNAATAGLIKRRTYQLERTMGNDGVGIQSEYLIGAVADSFTINMKQASKLDCDVSYVGMGIEERSGTLGVKSGTRVGLPGESAYNTSHDVYLSRIAVVDPATLNPLPLYGFASDIKLVINNGVVPNKAIGVQGGFDVSEGDFAVSGTLTAYFATIAAVSAVQTNADVNLQIITARANAGFIFDIPLLTLGGGGSKVQKDKPITVDLTQDAAKCPAGFTLLACFFEYLPTVAMPA